MITHYNVFQLAQEKGYNLFHNSALLWTKEGEEHLIRYIEPLLELTLIQKWLRDEHKIHIVIYHQKVKGVDIYQVNVQLDDERLKHIGHSESYEQALLEGIHEALKFINKYKIPELY
jgi:hypothetical protein